jgi:adenylate cyclase
LALKGDFIDWLIAAAVGDKPVSVLHRELCEKLVSLGLPIWRSSLGLEWLNPEIEGSQFRWVAHEVETRTLPRGSDAADYHNSPAKIVDDTHEAFRRRLDRPIGDMPLLEDLRQAGATDYYIAPLPFIDRQRTAHISFATQRPGGFSDEEIAGATGRSLWPPAGKIASSASPMNFRTSPPCGSIAATSASKKSLSVESTLSMRCVSE